MRPLRPANKLFIPLFVVAVALLATWNSQRAGNPPTPEQASFDFYLLAMTAHPAFCADGHASKRECRAGGHMPLSIHGLWPEKRAAGKYPRDCRGPALDLEDDLERDLARLMPGMEDGLHVHEWRKHGTCSGLDDDEYFDLTLRLAREVDEVMAERLTTLAGGATNAAELRAHAERARPGMGATLTFHCRTLRNAPPAHRQAPYLVEIRQCVNNRNGGAAEAPADCGRFNRRDQGCGREFRIAGRTGT